MSDYDTEELSVQDGAPIELYDFAQGTVEWHFTSAEVLALNVDDIDYTSSPIERGEIESTHEAARNSIKLTVPRNFPVAELFRVSPPTEIIGLTLRRYHRGFPDDIIVAWIGRVLTCEFNGAKATLSCEPISISLQRTGLRQVYGVSCPHVLYGIGCNLNKADFAFALQVDAVAGNVLVVRGMDSSFSEFAFAGGFIEWIDDNGITERRFIELQTGSTFTLMNPFAGIPVDADITAYPGCDHSILTCANVFHNQLNYGGQPAFPTKNPFEYPVF